MSHNEERWIKDYLLGGLPQERAQELEERLLRDESFAEQLLMVEDELIEDFARGALNPRERERFENHFLSTPRRQRKLTLVHGLRKYASVSGGAAPAPTEWSPRLWLQSILTPKWAAVAAALIVLAAGAGAWRAFLYRSDVEKGLLALNEAYRARRPLEVRVAGLEYAPFSATRGDEAVSPDSRARDRSAALLHTAAADDPSPRALQALGRVYLLQKEFDRAIAQFEEALKSAPDDARIHSDLGAALLEKGKLERASDQSGRSEATLAKSLGHLNKALELDGSLPDARFNRALLYQAMKLTPQALADWERYLSQDQHSPWAEEARKNIEQIREGRDKTSRREDDLFREFDEAHRAGDEERVWRVFSKSHLRTGNAVTSRLLDDYLKAAATGSGEEAERLAEALAQLGRLSGERADDLFTADVARLYRSATPGRRKALAQARGLMREGLGLYNQARNDQATNLFAQAKTLFEQSGDSPEALLADFWAGHCHSQRADAQSGLSLFADVLARAEGRRYRWLQAITRVGLANVRARATQYSQAVEDGWSAYKLSERAADGNGMLRSLSVLASLYRSLGKYHQSLRLAQQGLGLSSEVSADASQIIGLYATSAWSFNSLGHYAAALEYEKRALDLAGEMNNNPLVLSRYRVQLGLIQGKLKNYDEAVRNILLGIDAGQSLAGEKVGLEMTAYARLYLGRTYREAGRFAEALAALDEVVGFCRQNDQPWLLHEADKERLLTHIARGEIAPAREELLRVLGAYEEQRTKILEESNRNSFFDKEHGIYDVAIDFTHTRLGEAQQSLSYSETSRARSLLDASGADWLVQDGAEVPDLRFGGALKPMSVEEIRLRMPDRAQVLQYAVLGDKLIIWYVAKERFDSVTVSVGSEELAGKVDRLLSLVSRPPGVDDDGRPLLTAAAELYDILIRPAAPLLDENKLVCIVPDKSLYHLPFNVLFSTTARRHLVEDFALTYAPSSNMFVRDTDAAVGKGGARGEHLLAVGNPHFDREAFPDLDDLPSAEQEAAEISDFYEAHTLLTGAEATKVSVEREMRRANVLHLATHYLPDPTSPMFSKLLLAAAPEGPDQKRPADDVLQAHELYRLKPSGARLVILSACRTGVEGYHKGEGAFGLSRPFKTAGVPLVVASLWPVDSQATTDLMVEFHRLRRTPPGLPTGQALRGAQARMMNHPNPSYRRPYYWASFALAGGYSDY